MKAKEGPAWRPEHTQMVLLVLGALLFSLLIYLFVLFGKPPATPIEEEAAAAAGDAATETPAAEEPGAGAGDFQA